MDKSGQLYTLDAAGKLYKLDKKTGKTTLVGDTGYKSQYVGGCTIDESTGKMYRTIVNDLPEVSGLLEIDITTGASTLLASYPNEESVCGLYISGEGVADDPSAIDPPYTNTFDTEASLEGFTEIDANKDGSDWYWVSSDERGGFMRIMYNEDLAMDDWLITPPLRLKGGESYEVSLLAWANSFDERIELCLGTEPTAEAMTVKVLGPKALGSNDTELNPAVLTATIAPEKSGIYYLGIHGISDADNLYLNIDDLKISAPMSGRVPGTVTDLTAVAAKGGVKEVSISFTTPTVTVNNEALTSLTKVEVFRSGTEDAVKVFEAPATGAALSYTDTPATAGAYTYTVVASNADGKGAPLSADVFCGFNKPAAIASATIAEDATPGNVTVSWTAVTADIDGQTLTSADLTYTIYGFDEYGYLSPIAENLTTTAYSFTAVTGDEQDFVQYAVCAFTEAGNGQYAITDMVPVGKPYDGLRESFADGHINTDYIWGITQTDFAQWGLFDASSGIDPQDGDNGFIAVIGEYLEEGGELMSGKISLANLVNPALTFYTYNIAADDVNEVGVSIRAGNGEYAELKHATVTELAGGTEGWAKVSVDLSAYANDVICFKLSGIVMKYKYVIFDNIKVASTLANDLALASISAPAEVVAGSSYNVTVTVTNEGSNDATGWSVELYADGEKAATLEGSRLAPDTSMDLVFPCSMSPIATEAVIYTAKLIYAADEYPANNTSDELTVAPKKNKLPTVSDLEGSMTDEGVELKWTAPDLTLVPADPVTVTFEDGESFAQEYAGWTFIDKDGEIVGGFQGMDVPGIVAGSSTATYFIFDTSYYDGLHESFDAHSGNKYLAALFNYDGSPVNEWAISPELSGDAQTISFYAKSYSAEWPESIEVYYSTGSLDPADFVKVLTKTNLPEAWTLYSAELPAGATRFAIRSYAADAFMLMIDDITYTPAGDLQGVELTGYDIYRNGVKINGTPVKETVYVDTDAAEGDNTYVLTVVYNRGTSAPSNAVTVAYTGLESIAGGLTIRGGKSAITVTCAEGTDVTVASVDGKLVFDGKGSANTVIPAAAGVYVVKAGTRTAKVIVK